VDNLTGILAAAIEQVWNDPRVAVGLVIAGALLYYLLQRKSRLERDAERRLRQLKQEKAGRYDYLRPPQ
jgi:predicted PurR-regulated permease PerM